MREEYKPKGPGRPRKEDAAKMRMTEQRTRAAAHAKKHRDKRIAEGFAPMNIWVPREMRKELSEMVNAEVERRLALQVEPQRRRI